MVGKMLTTNAIMDPVLRPLLKMPPLLSIVIISLTISLIITFVYKLVTDQKKMKELRDGIKSTQEELKKHRANPKKMMEIQKKAMEKNMQYMISSLKPTLITLLPIILIFGWLNTNMGYYPLEPGKEFQVSIFLKEGVTGNVTLTSVPELDFVSNAEQNIEDSKVTWTLKGKAGEYVLEFEHNGESYQKDILITNERRYKPPIENIKDSFIKRIEISNKVIIYLNLLGWKIGWFGTYIIFSLIFSTGIRKLLRIY